MPALGQTGIVYTNLGRGMMNVTFPDGHGYTCAADTPIEAVGVPEDGDLLMLRLAIGRQPRLQQKIGVLLNTNTHATIIQLLADAEAFRPERPGAR